MVPSTPSTGAQSGTAERQSLGLQRLAAVCPDFFMENLKDAYLPKNQSAIKLSWPKEGNTKRAVVAKAPATSKSSHDSVCPMSNSDAHIINVTCEDIAVQYRYTGSVPNESTHPIFQVPSVWDARMLETGEHELLEYFQTVASRSLPTFGQDPVKIGQILLRIAYAGDGTSSGVAVQQALLAFSSAHRHSVHSRGTEYKIAALQSLADLSGCELGTTEAVRHVATGMLLCSYEMHHSSCTTGHWLSYLCGIQEIIQLTGLDTVHQDPDLDVLLDWVYYYNVLARFSRQHWQREQFAGIQLAPMRRHGEASAAATSPLAYIDLLSEMCDGAVAPAPTGASRARMTDHRNYLEILDWKIRSLPITYSLESGSNVELRLELYRLAMLIYLNRASDDALNQAAKTQQQVEQGFDILSGLEFCDQQFPVFILGCEARNDGEREAVLRLIQRTEEHGTCRAFNYVSRLLEVWWAQRDLGSDRDLRYWAQLSDVISRCAVLPTFV
ncbi:uncharacterized protein PG998_010460 [Apiospora kogelbergensis]|uniref:uncharacterized protein n=1 Tax=Apiospora kogelbergensis TaxID=1337665 RepID=UPI00312EF27C